MSLPATYVFDIGKEANEEDVDDDDETLRFTKVAAAVTTNIPVGLFVLSVLDHSEIKRCGTIAVPMIWKVRRRRLTRVIVILVALNF